MTKIFKQLARHWAVCLVVFALLFVQAYCDLALPDYTSKIVDTGIQQGGIESPLPQTVRKSTLDALSLLMNEEDAQKLQNAYQYYLQDDGVLQLRSDLTEDERTALEDAVTTPDIVLYMAAAQAANTPAGQSSMGMTGLAEIPSAAADTDTETVTPTAADLDTVCSQFAAMSQLPGFDRSMLQKQLNGAMSQLDSTMLENLKSQSLLLVQLEYEAQGVAQDVQMRYLFRVGGQMLALTLLMVAVAVAVGFLASRVSAAMTCAGRPSPVSSAFPTRRSKTSPPPPSSPAPPTISNRCSSSASSCCAWWPTRPFWALAACCMLWAAAAAFPGSWCWTWHCFCC